MERTAGTAVAVYTPVRFTWSMAAVRRPLAELFTHRRLVFALVWRDLKTRYRGSALGFLWTFLNPLLLMAIYSLVFAVYMRVQIPAYPAFVFAGLLPWNWFSTALLRGSYSIVESGDLMKKVYFPPHILPTAAAISACVNFLLSIPLLLALLLWSGVGVSWSLLALPLPLAVQFVLTVALATGASVLTVRYRDVHHLLVGVMTLWFFLTPVVYPADWVPAALRPLLLLNPVAALTLAFQDAFYYHRPPDLLALAAVTVMAGALLAAALCLLERFRWVLVEEV